MCGRSTYTLTWGEIVRLYRLTLNQPAVNTQARYNICPTTTIDTIVGQISKRRLVPMRWGLVPSWWSKPLKELKLATFNVASIVLTLFSTTRVSSRRVRFSVSRGDDSVIWRARGQALTVSGCVLAGEWSNALLPRSLAFARWSLHGSVVPRPAIETGIQVSASNQ
jgi:hypothetical protein